MGNEPVIAGFSVPVIVAAVVNLLVVFDVWDPTAEQVAAINTVAVIVVSIVAALIVRARVTPTAKTVPLPPPEVP